MALDHLRLEDMSDREVLLVMLDVADPDGGDVDPLDVAEQLGVRGDNPRRVVSARLAWLKRFGAVERVLETDEHGNVVRNRKGEPRTTQRYRLTPIGWDMANGQLRATQEKALQGIGDAEMLLVTQWLTQRARESGTTVANLVRREWVYRTLYATNGRRPTRRRG